MKIWKKKKKSHSKVKQLNHNTIKMQTYLQAQLIFKLRCKVTEVKVNLKGSYDYLECGACGLEEESQKHIIQCEKLNQVKRTEGSETINIEIIIFNTQNN